MIRVRAAGVSRGSTPVVDGLSVDIGAGRIYWVVGPNGAGKSTLLRVLAGLAPPRAGSVAVLPTGSRVLYFASDATLPPAATVSDWERLIQRLAGGAPLSLRTALWPAVPGSRRVTRLSTGERKRLLLDALLRQTGPMVLDEPFEHLSPEAKGELHRLLQARSREHVVVVATNQGLDRARQDGGLRLEGGAATLLDPEPARPTPGSPAGGAP